MGYGIKKWGKNGVQTRENGVRFFLRNLKKIEEKPYWESRENNLAASIFNVVVITLFLMCLQVR